jgi:hypothetical protein
MTLEKFSENKIFKFPIERDEEDFPVFTSKLLDEYFKLIDGINDEIIKELRPNLPIIYELIERLKLTAEHYFTGQINKSYTQFKGGLTLIKNFLWLEDTNLILIQSEANEVLNKQHFFKSRMSYGKGFPKNEMFIRPFDQRENIETYRYSIPGLPCLYLSNSIYGNWTELNCPDINLLQVSRFEISNEIKKLHFEFDFSFFYRAIKNAVKQPIDYTKLVRYLTYFPIHLLCNIKVKNRQSIFKPEYIFPQFLMQWISENEISCVQYISTQLNFNHIHDNLFFYFSNLAIPAKTTNKSGYCDFLKKEIKLTDTISWPTLLASYPDLKFPKLDKNNFNNFRKEMQEIEIIKNHKVKYSETIFGKMENFLIDNMEASFFTD